MGRTALYREPIPFRSATAEVQLDPDVMTLQMPDGRQHRHVLHGYEVVAVDARRQRRFVRMLILERGGEERVVVITPPEDGSVAPNVVRMPEAPDEAAVVDRETWDILSEWILGGGRLAACSIIELARLAAIATPQFAVLIGEVAAQRALELVWAARGPLRGVGDLEAALLPFVDAARQSPRAGEALISALAHAAGATRRRRRG